MLWCFHYFIIYTLKVVKVYLMSIIYLFYAQIYASHNEIQYMLKNMRGILLMCQLKIVSFLFNLILWAVDRVRTCDLVLGRNELYQLSYYRDSSSWDYWWVVISVCLLSKNLRGIPLLKQSTLVGGAVPFSFVPTKSHSRRRHSANPLLNESWIKDYWVSLTRCGNDGSWTRSVRRDRATS